MLLVTGITGHTGQYFVQELVNNKYADKIRCTVRSSSDTTFLDNCGLQIEKVVGDLSDQAFLDDCMKDIDTVFHIGHIHYSAKVIKSAVKNNVKQAILVHTTGIYSKYKSASEEYKNIEAEVKEIIENNDSTVGLIILRPTMIYGNVRDRNMIVFIKMVDKLRLFPVIDDGRNLLQPVNARDLGKAYYQVLAKSDIMNGDYILSGDKPRTMLEIFKSISALLGKRTVFFNVPLGIGVFLAKMLKAFTFGKVDYVEKVQRMGEDRSFSHEEAARDFGYAPMPFSQGLELEITQYKNLK